MKKLAQSVVNFLAHEDGPTAVEYAVMLALIIVVCIAAITTLGNNANTTFTTVAAAIIDWWKFKVPNKLTFPLILSGWLLGLANNLGLEAGDGGFGAALAGT